MKQFANSPELQIFYGDIHNHCNLSYGQGTIEEAFENAKLQLDFCSVTLHAAWPDLPTDDPDLGYLVDYHKEGFAIAQNNWQAYLETVEAHNQNGSFVSFPSFEWHSMQDGDHCIYYQSSQGAQILDAPTLAALRASLKQQEIESLLLPHHIGYKQGFRGINWFSFNSELSPVAEIFSFHGQAESSEGSYPYLHSMGPRHEQSTAQYGWSQGHVFGLVGSTDHHNAFPGSYGYGRMAVWAENLSRETIWQAIKQRRTYALTGDRIALAFSLNGQPMGSICEASPQRTIKVQAEAGSSIDYLEILHNNQVLHRESVFPKVAHASRFKLAIEMGWGERPNATHWDFELCIAKGRLIGLEPRLRGYGPSEQGAGPDFAYHHLAQTNNGVKLNTQTRANPSLHTAATESICLELEADADTVLNFNLNGQAYELSFCELLTGSRSFYLGGFVSPALCFHRAVPETEYRLELDFSHQWHAQTRDWYHLRLRQRNDQWAWTSPIWVKPS